jgi:hypothetical protein
MNGSPTGGTAVRPLACADPPRRPDGQHYDIIVYALVGVEPPKAAVKATMRRIRPVLQRMAIELGNARMRRRTGLVARLFVARHDNGRTPHARPTTSRTRRHRAAAASPGRRSSDPEPPGLVGGVRRGRRWTR